MSEVMEKPAEAGEKRVVILNPQRRALRETWRQDWVVNAEVGTTVEDVMQPQFWAHVAADMQPYDRVEVLLETGEWLLELIAIGVGRNWVQMHLAQKYDLAPLSEALPSATKHKIEWKGPQHKFAVIRIADSQKIQDGFASRGEASAWLSNHERVTG